MTLGNALAKAAQGWTDHEFAGLDLSDARLNKRARKSHGNNIGMFSEVLNVQPARDRSMHAVLDSRGNACLYLDCKGAEFFNAIGRKQPVVKQMFSGTGSSSSKYLPGINCGCLSPRPARYGENHTRSHNLFLAGT